MRGLMFAVPLLLAASPSMAQGITSDIQKLENQFAQAANKQDAAAVAQFYTEDATALPAGADMVKGRDGIQKLWDAILKSGTSNLMLTTVSVEDYGQAAREIGQFSFDAHGQQGQSSKVEGKYVVVWKKIGGDWRLDTDIWNMNK